jgi:cation:H+ antiporter
MARALGASELVIALTIVAAGTSMPELATSLVASFRGQRDIAIGNIVGSNIFNIFAVVGVTATVSPQGLAAPPAALAFDIPVAMAVAAVCLPIFFTGGRIARWEGVVMVGYYVAYVTCLVLAATGHPQLGTLQSALLWFVLPLTLLGIAVSVYYERQKIVSQRRQDAAGRGEH